MKLSETQGDLRNQRLEYVEVRWKQLHEQVTTRANQAWTYLMVTNSGGAVAVLGFIGAMKSVTAIPGAIWMLSLFVVGVVLVGLGRAVAYYRGQYLFEGWRRDVAEYYQDRTGWKTLLERDEKRATYFVLADVIAWLSFLCFVSGVTIGLISMLPS